MSRVIFEAKMAELKASKGKSGTMFSNEEYQQYIEKLLELERSAMLFRPVNIDDTVLLPVEDVDRSKLDPPNLHALVIDVIGEVGYKLAVTSGVHKGVFSRHHFKHSPTNFLSRSDIDFERVDLAIRTASWLQSFNKDRKPTKCGCKGNCSNKHCKCKKNNFSCNSKCACNSGKGCKNRDT